MEHLELFILTVGFIGSWFLFAGPIYQAALELKDEDVQFDRIRTVQYSLERPSDISPWWWLLPPVKIILEYIRSKKFQRMYLNAFLPEDIKAVISLRNKATAWFIVSVGGLCIAAKETYELCEAIHTPVYVYILIMIVMAILSVLYTIQSLIRTYKIHQKIDQ